MLASLLFTQKLYTLSANFKGRINYLKKDIEGVGQNHGGWSGQRQPGLACVSCDYALWRKKIWRGNFIVSAVSHAEVENEIR